METDDYDLIDMDADHASSEHSPSSDVVALQSEVDRLRALVGPSEKSYEDLVRDAVDARDAARRAMFEAGKQSARVVELENEVRRWQRDFVWFRNQVIRRVPVGGKLMARLRRP